MAPPAYSQESKESEPTSVVPAVKSEIADETAAKGELGKEMEALQALKKKREELLREAGSANGDNLLVVDAEDNRRVDMVFGIGYGDDIEKAQSVLEELVSAHPSVLAEPAPVICLHNLADSAVEFVVRPWAASEDYWKVYWDLTKAVKHRFDDEKISIPFPQHDMHVYKHAG